MKKRNSLKKRRGNGKKSKAHGKRGSRRIRVIRGGKFVGAPSGTNDFANYYLATYANEILKEKSPIKFVENVVVTPGSILWVIDMQNDFIDIPMEGLSGPDTFNPDNVNIGAFAVSEGSAVIDKLVTFMKTHANQFEKIIFTRDWHPENHCSFDKSQVGTFPPHCIWNKLGAAFNDTIANTIQRKNDKFTCNGRPVDILFKGHHQDTDSFSGVSWEADTAPEYPFKNRQLTTCCQALDCKGKTGARPLKPDFIQYSKEVNIMCDAGVDCFAATYDLPKPTGDGEIFVVGLAGEFCVKDTAIMLKKNFPDKTVNVVQDLTRYVFVPVFLPFQRYPLTNGDNANPCEFGELLMKGDWINNTAKNNILSDGVFEENKIKPLSQYLFSYNPSNPTDTKRLEYEDLSKYNNVELTPTNPNLWHFASDHRILLKDYAQFGVQLLMPTNVQQRLMVKNEPPNASKNEEPIDFN
jgi:nicotinamidase-related amidase